MKKVLVYGATGSQQGQVIGMLVKKGVEVFAVTHSEAKFDILKNMGATPISGNMEDVEVLTKITKGMDGVSFAIPAEVSDPQNRFVFSKNIIDAAKANNVKHIVWNTSGYLDESQKGNPVNDAKISVKKYLESSGVPYTIIESNIYLENLLGPYTTSFVKAENKLAYPLPANMRVGWVATKDVAQMVAATLGKQELVGKMIRVSGSENLTGHQLANQISEGLGVKLDFYAMPPTEFGQILSKFMDKNAVNGIVHHYQEIADSAPNYPSWFSKNMPEVINQLGITMTSVAEWAKDHKANFLE